VHRAADRRAASGPTSDGQANGPRAAAAAAAAAATTSESITASVSFDRVPFDARDRNSQDDRTSLRRPVRPSSGPPPSRSRVSTTTSSGHAPLDIRTFGVRRVTSRRVGAHRSQYRTDGYVLALPLTGGERRRDSRGLAASRRLDRRRRSQRRPRTRAGRRYLPRYSARPTVGRNMLVKYRRSRVNFSPVATA